MALSPGTKLGPYEVLSPAGAGGMGEVYRARDTRLDRTVAIKVLPAQFSENPDLKQRFEREARAISSLNHPNICHLYDVGHQDGTDYLVMEYIEGESLAQRVSRGPLPLEQALKTGTEIADALDKAHRQGIVHRDLKPGNVMLTKSGAKLLDFGLAKPAGVMRAASGSNEVAVTATSPPTPITQQGHIVGTFQYMAPEQVEGKEADARSDIFALGAVLYEMATGKRAFEGKSAISIASAILEKDPEPISKSQPLTPPAFEHVVSTCLAKDPDARWQSAADVARQLRWVQASGSQVAPVPVARRRRDLRVYFGWAVAAVLLIAAVLWIATGRRSSPDVATVSSILPPEGAVFNQIGNFGGPAMISPDGRKLVFTASGQDGKAMLWLRDLGQDTARVLPGTENPMWPFWSPDSSSIGFFAGSKLKRSDIAGGPAVTLCDAPAPRGGSWGAGFILFTASTQSAVSRVDDSGGTPVDVTHVDARIHTTHRWPYVLPDAKHFLYLAADHRSPTGEQNAIYWASVDGKQSRMVVRSVANVAYADGMLIFMRENTVMAQPFDQASGALSGQAAPIAEHVAYDNGVWRGLFTVSANGVLLYEPGTTASNVVRLEWRDRSGKALGNIGDPEGQYNGFDLSHDGKRLMTSIGDPTSDLWMLDAQRNTKTRFSFNPAQIFTPLWSPDDRYIVYVGNPTGKFVVYRKLADGSAPEEAIADLPGSFGFLDDYSPDGKHVIFQALSNDGWSIWQLSMSDKKPQMLLQSRPNQGEAKLSPDGRWMAYVSDESGRNEVYVTAYPTTGAKWQVSSEGGGAPHWSRDGKTLYYLTGTNSIMAARVNGSGASFQLESSALLFRLPPGSSASLAVYGTGPSYFLVTPDEKRFLIGITVNEASNKPLTMVTNWPARLKK